MDHCRKLLRQIEEAEYVRYDEPRDLFIVWRGSNTVNVYAVETGKEVSCWTLGFNPEGTPPSRTQVRESIEQRIAKGDYP